MLETCSYMDGALSSIYLGLACRTMNGFKPAELRLNNLMVRCVQVALSCILHLAEKSAAFRPWPETPPRSQWVLHGEAKTLEIHEAKTLEIQEKKRKAESMKTEAEDTGDQEDAQQNKQSRRRYSSSLRTDCKHGPLFLNALSLQS